MKTKNGIIVVCFAMLSIVVISACKKDSSSTPADPTAITVANISGTYSLTDLAVAYAGLSFDIYDSIPACEKDNLITLNTNLTASFKDAGVVCSPSQDSSGAWSLSNDTLYYSGNAAKIKSYDGKTLVLTGYETTNGQTDSTFLATSTLTKQ